MQHYVASENLGLTQTANTDSKSVPYYSVQQSPGVCSAPNTGDSVTATLSCWARQLLQDRH